MRYIFIFLATLSLCADDGHIEKYLKFLEQHREGLGKTGNYKEREIEIVTDLKKVREIEKLQKARCLKQGMSEEGALLASRIGVISEDLYWVFIRDAVIFPSGAEGSYNRILLKKSLDNGVPAVAVLPILSDGKVAAIISFRHATRSWELELPKGFKQKNETVENAVNRELEEETGFHSKENIFLGEVAPDPSMTNSLIPVYAAKVEKQSFSNQDYFEAIFGVKTFTIPELKEAFVKGYIEVDMKGKKEKVLVRDSYLVYALSLAECRKII